MISGEEFMAAMSRFASGVTVVTTADAAGRRHGLTVSAFCSLSAEPPLILVCIHRQTASHYAFLERQAFVVHILGEDQQHISQHFASPADDKFHETENSASPGGLPLIEGALVRLECRVVNTLAGGDHTVIVGSVESADIRPGEPLIYYHHGYRKIDS